MIGWMELSDKRMDNIQVTLMLDRSLRMKPGGEKSRVRTVITNCKNFLIRLRTKYLDIKTLETTEEASKTT